eukprot:jgi/Botrbrau1/19663/Bobra.0003s0027.1
MTKQARTRRRTTLTATILACLQHFLIAQTQPDGILTCRPQDLLKLSKPFPLPMPVPGGLPFCEQYSTCTCCTAIHVAEIYRSIVAVLEDTLISARCREWTRLMACRVCDPEVGVGSKPATCLEACEGWYAACRNDFFEFVEERLRPCSPKSQRSLVCSQLKELAGSGAGLCAAAGLPVATSAAVPCFDGTVPPALPACLEAGRRLPDRDRKAKPSGGKPLRSSFSWSAPSLELWLVCGTALAAAYFARRAWVASVARQRRAGNFPGRPRTLR